MYQLPALNRFACTIGFILIISGFSAAFFATTALAAPFDFDIPAQPLATSLKQVANATGISVAFDSKIAEGITAPAIKGKMEGYEAIRKLLADSGLAATTEGTTTLIRRTFDTPKDNSVNLNLGEVSVRAKRFHDIGPMPGLGLTKEEIPGNVQSITAKEIKEAHALSLTDLMNSKLQSVNVNDYQSNPFQMDVTYRGFTASPQLGTAQGLSVFLDGIRVNEPFGDVVNWDMIPLNALNSFDVFPGSNPIFGLGTLGGALSMRTKSGFDNPEASTEILTGSFGRKQLQVSAGGNNGIVAGFVAANLFMEDGWRENSPSRVNQVFGKAEWRNDSLQLGLSTLFAGNKLVGNGVLPEEVASVSPSSVFTSPDKTENRLMQYQLSSTWDISETFSITGQLYRRNSNRKSSTGDINQDFGGYATRRPNPGEKISPGYADTNGDGLPDYSVYDNNVATDNDGIPLDTNGDPLYVPDPSGTSPTGYINNPASNGVPLVGTNVLVPAITNQGTTAANQGTMLSPVDGITVIPLWGVANPFVSGVFNEVLPAGYYAYALAEFKNISIPNYQSPIVKTLPGSGGTTNIASGSSSNFFVLASAFDGFSGGYTDNGGFFHSLSVNPPINVTGICQNTNSCVVDPNIGDLKIIPASVDRRLGKPFILAVVDVNGNIIPRDGADGFSGLVRDATTNGKGTGYVDGTPTALITTTDIDQVTDGGAVQLNWSLDKHKFMVGASIDQQRSTYQSAQQLGLLDVNHNAYTDPDALGYELAAATTPIGLNNFAGNGVTKSIYASETWSPIDTLHFNAAARYNVTNMKNTLAINNTVGLKGPGSFLNFYDLAALCPTTDPTSCPSGSIIPFTVERALGFGVLGPPVTEEFSYHSLNPSFGTTWQATPKLNVYGNWSQGARTPSVIELGCAYDNTPVRVNAFIDAAGNPIDPIYGPRGLLSKRFCSLPSTLSGDPYLPQVVSRTTEFGARGYLNEDIEWNATVYQTKLQDDIYFVSYSPDRSYFQSIGATRRRGVEMGVKGKSGRASFSLNYSLTDATFQSSFLAASPNNSSAGADATQGSTYQQIQVEPGDRMPGVPLNNINASFGYDVTQDWHINLSMIMHSGAYVRGNENNKHQVGPATPATLVNLFGKTYTIQRPDFEYPGRTAGYAVFNFSTSYKLDKNLTFGLQINNLFDRSYASAGRLGINPFSPSINGVIGPSGFNYNSNDWRSSTFVAPGAPRGVWATLTYDFDMGK